MESYGTNNIPLPVKKFNGLYRCNEYLRTHRDEYKGRTELEIRKAYRVVDPEGNDITMIFWLLEPTGFIRYYRYRVYENTH